MADSRASAIVRSASISIARPSLVNSSVTVRHLSCYPMAQRSNTKSVRPRLVRPGWSLWPRPNRSDAFSSAACAAPASASLATVATRAQTHPMSVAAQEDANASIAITRILRCQRRHPSRRRLSIIV